MLSGEDEENGLIKCLNYGKISKFHGKQKIMKISACCKLNVKIFCK